MANKRIYKPSPQTVGITTLLLGLVGLIAGVWYYQEHQTTRTQRLRHQADRQIRRIRGNFQHQGLSSGTRTGLLIGALGAGVAGALFGGTEVYRRTHR